MVQARNLLVMPSVILRGEPRLCLQVTELLVPCALCSAEPLEHRYKLYPLWNEATYEHHNLLMGGILNCFSHAVVS